MVLGPDHNIAFLIAAILYNEEYVMFIPSIACGNLNEYHVSSFNRCSIYLAFKVLYKAIMIGMKSCITHILHNN